MSMDIMTLNDFFQKDKDRIVHRFVEAHQDEFLDFLRQEYGKLYSVFVTKFENGRMEIVIEVKERK